MHIECVQVATLTQEEEMSVEPFSLRPTGVIVNWLSNFSTTSIAWKCALHAQSLCIRFKSHATLTARLARSLS